MPPTEVIFYQEANGTAPVKQWLEGLNRKVQIKCIAYIDRLSQKGHELRRPIAAPLRDHIHELRPSLRRVHYRILYFFHRQTAVLAHGCIKEGEVDDRDINRAIKGDNCSKLTQSSTRTAKRIETMTRDATKILDRMVGDDDDMRLQIVLAGLAAEIAEHVYEARTHRNLTQQELADLIGSSQSAIARVEDADYDGRSIRTLAKIACALQLRLSVRFSDEKSSSGRNHPSQSTGTTHTVIEGEGETNERITSRGAGGSDRNPIARIGSQAGRDTRSAY